MFSEKNILSKKETKKPKEKTSNDLSGVNEILEELKVSQETELEIRERLAEKAYFAIKSALSSVGKFYEDVNEVYRLCKGDFVVRREDPMKAINILVNKEDLKISPDSEKSEEEYANCCMYDSEDIEARGLKSALNEGLGQVAGLSILIGFKPNSQFHISEVEKKFQKINNIDRSTVRIGEGTLKSEDVKFALIRIPGTLLPLSELTEKESEQLYKYEEAVGNYEKQKRIGGLKDLKKPDPPQFFRGFIPE